MFRVLYFLFFLVSHLSFAQRLKRVELNLPALPTIHCTPVKDQHMSSTCWSFSSISLLESELIKAGKVEVDLSEMFIARHSMLRKIHRHLKLKGGNFFTPGGQFHDAVWVMKNFGLVPEEAYPGKGRGELNHNHAEMDTILSRMVKGLIEKGVVELDQKQNETLNKIFDYYYGPVPAEFIYRGRLYTSFSFMEQYLGIHPDDYIEITSYTHHPFYSKFVLEDQYNWTGDEY
ncbi:MAG: hypothetical protein FJY20_08095 [Bacteroidetes bacterium]|nr:hypothetical protein [Bacteroidota bacterium]